MQITQAAVDLIKEFEGLELTAYRDPVGILTIGYGTTSRAGIGVTVREGMVITKTQAEEFLVRALEKFASELTPLFTRTPDDNQFGAMLSLAYNIGSGAFARSTCLKRFNAGDSEGAAQALTWFNKAGGKVLRGLVRRREAERDLFLGPPSLVVVARPDEPRGSLAQSKTMRANTLVKLAAASPPVVAAVSDVPWQTVAALCGLALVALLASGLIDFERIAKWDRGDR